MAEWLHLSLAVAEYYLLEERIYTDASRHLLIVQMHLRAKKDNPFQLRLEKAMALLNYSTGKYKQAEECCNFILPTNGDSVEVINNTASVSALRILALIKFSYFDYNNAISYFASALRYLNEARVYRSGKFSNCL